MNALNMDQYLYAALCDDGSGVTLAGTMKNVIFRVGGIDQLKSKVILGLSLRGLIICTAYSPSLPQKRKPHTLHDSLLGT